MEPPPLFRCPISMDLMEEPMTIETGVTYERKNIERWLFTYKKLTCPATMQRLDNFDLIPNHTVKRLITSWQDRKRDQARSSPSSSLPPSLHHERLVSLLSEIESTPFKVSSLKKLRSVFEKSDDDVQLDFIRSGGVEVLGRIMSQIESLDFSVFRACEEALGVLHHLPLSDEASVELMLKPECMKSMMIMLQRGSVEARLHAMSILQKISKTNHDWCNVVSEDIITSLLELLSDEISTRLTSSSLDVLILIMFASKMNRRKAIEAGAMCILIELLPDSSRHNCERILMLVARLCECPEGRSAFADHGLAISVVSKKIIRVSEQATKYAVKTLWLICNFLPTDKILDEMMVFGSVRKLLGLLHIGGRSSAKDKAMKIIKLHGGVWQQYPCFPCELKECLGLASD